MLLSVCVVGEKRVPMQMSQSGITLAYKPSLPQVEHGHTLRTDCARKGKAALHVLEFALILRCYFGLLCGLNRQGNS